MLVADTNLLVYAANADCMEHRNCAALIQEWRREGLPWYVTWPIVYEFLRVTTHNRVFTQPWSLTRAWSFVEVLAEGGRLGFLVQTRRHREIATRTFSEIPHLRGNLLHDVHTAILMREHGIRRIYTRDTDFHRFPFLEVIDPVGDLN